MRYYIDGLVSDLRITLRLLCVGIDQTGSVALLLSPSSSPGAYKYRTGTLGLRIGCSGVVAGIKGVCATDLSFMTIEGFLSLNLVGSLFRP